jgi:hypothetical protein
MAETIASISGITSPEWYEDPLYQQTQDQLYSYGTDILSGNTPSTLKTLSGLIEGDIPDYYKAIGETGSTEFNNMLALTVKNTANAVNEDLVRRGVSRGGVGASVTSKAMADKTAELSYADYTRALEGKQSLLNLGVQANEYINSLGVSTLSGVGSSAADMTNQKNTFNLGVSNLELSLASQNAQIAEFNAKAKAAEEAQANALWSQILSSSIGALGSVGGAVLGSSSTTTTTPKTGSADYSSILDADTGDYGLSF